MTRQLALSVKGRPAGIDYFVQVFIAHIAVSMLQTPEGVVEIINLKRNIRR